VDNPAPVIGKNLPFILGRDENLIELARRAGVGYLSLVEANQEVDPWLPRPYQHVLIPYSAILPMGAQKGITINLAEFRLYLIWRRDGRRRVRIYPVGIGRKGWPTPEGDFRVKVKIDDPNWTMPEDIHQVEPGEPVLVPAGPGNPLGDVWLGLTAPGVGIHGTNKPFGVGRRVSHGCIRLYASDIRDLEKHTRVGTPVHIIYQPIKVGLQGKTLVAEVHPDYMGKVRDPLGEVLRQEKKLHWRGSINWTKLAAVLHQARGIPEPISGPYP
jgi:L,D-transpeptidase ErfK/SrfK